jgi:uncharacterized delta-60 repeat protein
MKRLLTKAVILTTYNLLLITFGLAQPGALDLTFNPGSGGNGDILTIALQPDGKILVAGTFTVFNGVPMGRIARLNANGSLDTTFQVTPVGFSNMVTEIALSPDGKVYVGGVFANFNGSNNARLVRLHTNGTLDTTFNKGSGFNGAVYTIKLQPDGKLVAGGNFTTYNGDTARYLVRINADGSRDTTFKTLVGANGAVHSTRLLPDSTLLIGGSFTLYDNDYCLRIAKVKDNGRRDSSFVALPGASSVVTDMAVQPDGRIVITGDFTQYDLQPRNKIARLLSHGGLDASFNIGSGADDNTNDILIFPDGRILISGNFSNVKGVAKRGLVMFFSNGDIDNSFNLNQVGADSLIVPILEQPDKKLLVAGRFANYNGHNTPRIARLYNCLTPQPDSIYGNSYALCSGTPQNYSVTPVSGAIKYEWTLPNGWVGSSDSASITATGNGIGGTITVKAFTDSCGWSYTTTRTIATIQPDAVPLCLVTVDTQSTHNIVMWEKPQTALIDSFFIYRETTSNVYTKLAAVAYNALSEYHDTAANPNATSYRYKLSVLDTCGAESDLSLYHSTIHLQNLGNGNFQWTFYNIESTANPVTSFNVYRDAFGNGNWFAIGNVPGTNSTFTDVTANSFPNALYVVDVNWGISCDPSRAVNTTRSNIKHKGIIDVPLAIGNEWRETVQVFPNPAKDRLRVMLPDGITVEAIKLINGYGQLVKETRNSGNGEIELYGIPAGVYGLWIETNAGRVVRKVVIE